MLKKKASNIIYIRKGEKPSRFLVNLNQISSENSENKPKDKWSDKILDKIADFNFEKIFKAKGAEKPIVEKIEQIIEENIAEIHKEKKHFGLNFSWFKKAFLRVFKGLDNFCFKVGYGTVFVFGFVIMVLPVGLKLFFHHYRKTMPVKKKTFFVVQEFPFRTIRKAFGFFNSGKKNVEEDEVELPKRDKVALFKSTVYFSVFLLIIILPLKGVLNYRDLQDLRGRVLGVSEAAVGGMIDASKSAAGLDFNKASESFAAASDDFLKAKNEIGQISGLLSVLAAVVPNNDIKLASNADLILEAGRLSAELGNRLSAAMNVLQSEDKNIKNILDSFYENGKVMVEYAHQIKDIIEKINPDYLPAEYKDRFIEMKEKSDLIESSLEELVDILGRARVFLGLNKDKRYLLVFQNNTEMRASGGFIGSYALIDFSDGKIKKIEAPGGGSYDTEGGLKKRIIAPNPLHLVNPLWHFWDANWWPDWPTTAEKLMWFLEKSNGPTVDGVISFTPTVIERMLQVIGPIDMTKDYGLVLTAENFWLEVQRVSEQKPIIETASSTLASSTCEISTSTPPEVKHTPKKIIGDLMDKIIEELPGKLNKETAIKLAGIMEQSLSEKHILFYFTDKELQSKVDELDWGGRLKSTLKDYLMVINTNIAGGKSDKEIQEEIRHEFEVSPDGTIVNTVIIKRIHTGLKNEEFTGVQNVDWMRIYVPLGSKLIEARGFVAPDRKYFEDPEKEWEQDPEVAKWEGQAITDINSGTKVYHELDKTVFANWCMVKPGQSAEIYIKYKLPFKIEKKQEDQSWWEKIKAMLNPGQKDLSAYSLLVQKQPGSMGSKITSYLKLPKNLKMIWQYPDNSSKWIMDDVLDTDKFKAALIQMD